MSPERFRLLAAVIAAHPKRQVIGRTRLQNTIKLLQRLGLQTDYDYMLHFYGPYSDGLQAEIGLLEHLGLVVEESPCRSADKHSYVIKSKPEAVLEEVEKKFGNAIKLMAQTDPVVLELAATYDALREAGMAHKQALEVLRRKKGSKCKNSNEEKAFGLLKELGVFKLYVGGVVSNA